MTGPNPDADLDEALGVTELPPAAVTEEHRRIARAAYAEVSSGANPQAVSQAIADAEQRGAARVIAEHEAAGT